MRAHQSDEVLARVQDNGETALAEVFMVNRAELRRLVRRRLDARLSRRVDASDILQEGFVNAARRLDAYLQRPAMPLLLWLKVILVQSVIEAYRRHICAKKRDIRREDTPHVVTDGSSPACLKFEALCSDGTPSEIISNVEERSRLSQAISNLKPLDRELIRLRHEHRLSNSEAAQRLKLSPAAASKRYIRALASLRASL